MTGAEAVAVILDRPINDAARRAPVPAVPPLADSVVGVSTPGDIDRPVPT